MTLNELAGIITSIVAALNTLAIAYMVLYKGKREAAKTEVEADNEFIEGAERSAKLSEDLLTQRIKDLKEELEALKVNSKAELQAEREARGKEIEAEREARRKEGEYLRKRLREAEREGRDLRRWAAALVKQVVEAGKEPARFIPSLSEDSDQLNAITREQEVEYKKGKIDDSGKSNNT